MAKGQYDKDNPAYKHGYNKRGQRHPLYNIWSGMRKRCENPKAQHFSRYGGRGISVCDEWYSAATFIEWALANGWVEGLSIDRIDIDGNYEPTNCRWITVSQNSKNHSRRKLSDAQVESIRDRIANGGRDHAIAAEFGVSHGTIWWIRKGITHQPDGVATQKLKERGYYGRPRRTKVSGT